MGFARIYGIIGVIALGVLVWCFMHRDVPPHTLTLQDIADMPTLKVGDMIFRQGVGVESEIIQKISASPYSHIGLVIQTDPIIILHATTTDDPHKPNQTITSSLESFVAHARRIAIKRLELPSRAYTEIATQARDEYVGRAFVLNDSPEAFYCTSLIEEILGRYLTFELRPLSVQAPIVGGTYLFPQAFFENTQSQLVYQSP